jgi:hypothetical protein
VVIGADMTGVATVARRLEIKAAALGEATLLGGRAEVAAGMAALENALARAELGRGMIPVGTTAPDNALARRGLRRPTSETTPAAAPAKAPE